MGIVVFVIFFMLSGCGGGLLTHQIAPRIDAQEDK